MTGNGASIMWCETIPSFYMLKDPMIFQPLLQFQTLPSWLLSCSTVTSGMFRESLATSVVFLGFSAKTKKLGAGLELETAQWQCCNMYVFVCIYIHAFMDSFVRSFVHACIHSFTHSFHFILFRVALFFCFSFFDSCIYLFMHLSNLTMYSFFDVCTVLVYFLFVYFHM